MLTRSRLESLLANFPHLTIGLVGDLFLDRYLDIEPGVKEISIETDLEAYQIATVRNSPGPHHWPLSRAPGRPTCAALQSQATCDGVQPPAAGDGRAGGVHARRGPVGRRACPRDICGGVDLRRLKPGERNSPHALAGRRTDRL